MKTNGTAGENEWQPVATSGTVKDNEWQRLTTSATTTNSEWEWMTTSNIEWYQVIISAKYYFLQIMWYWYEYLKNKNVIFRGICDSRPPAPICIWRPRPAICVRLFFVSQLKFVIVIVSAYTNSASTYMY